MQPKNDNGIYFFLGNISSHILHALPLWNKLGGTFVVTSKQTEKEIQKYDVPIARVNNIPYRWTKPGKRPKRVHEYLMLDKKLKKTYDFLNSHANVVIFYELFELQHPEWLTQPKKIFLTHGNMLKNYMTSHPKRLENITHYDYMAALSPYMKEKFIKDGVPSEKLVDLGIARVDSLINDIKKRNELRHTLANNLGFAENKKLLFYAPTFWGTSSVSSTGIEIAKNISDDYVLLFRPHPQTPKRILQKYSPLIKNQLNVFNVSDLPITDLLVSCDIFIGDMSSIVLEAILLDTPIIFALSNDDSQNVEQDYDSIKEIVDASLSITPRNAHDINKIVTQALERGINKSIWNKVRKRVWFSQQNQTETIERFIRSLLKK